MKLKPIKAPLILDPASGGRLMYFDRADRRVLFGDVRTTNRTYESGKRSFIVSPDMVMDFRQLPFANESFTLVVFDPPHLTRAGDKSIMVMKYGKCSPSWEEDMRLGFQECFRVLKAGGTLIFKWSERDIKLESILKAALPQTPLFGDRGRGRDTHWIVFFKDAVSEQ